jgi:hypothetical protein
MIFIFLYNIIILTSLKIPISGELFDFLVHYIIILPSLRIPTFRGILSSSTSMLQRANNMIRHVYIFLYIIIILPSLRITTSGGDFWFFFLVAISQNDERNKTYLHTRAQISHPDPVQTFIS